MKVKELIALLQAQDPEMEVVVVNDDSDHVQFDEVYNTISTTMPQLIGDAEDVDGEPIVLRCEHTEGWHKQPENVRTAFCIAFQPFGN